MSQSRQTEILEQFVANGWTATKYTSGGAENITVTSGPGQLGRLLVLDAVAVTPYDGTAALWDAINNADFDTSSTPIQFTTSLVLSFAGAVSAWVLYKAGV